MQQIAVADQQLLRYQQEHEPEALHQLRVAIKKIKAVAYFIEHLSGQKIDTTPLKELFEKAGAVRELQLMMQWVQSFLPEKDRLFHDLQNDLKKADEAFNQAIPYLGLSLQYFKNHVSLPKEFPPQQQVIDCFQKLLKKAKLHHRRDQLHHYRIAIKRIMYIYEALPEVVKQKVRLDTDQIHQQQKRLGQWHDSFMIKKYLHDQLHIRNSSPAVMLVNKQEHRQFEAIACDSLKPLLVKEKAEIVQ